MKQSKISIDLWIFVNLSQVPPYFIVRFKITLQNNFLFHFFFISSYSTISFVRVTFDRSPLIHALFIQNYRENHCLGSFAQEEGRGVGGRRGISVVLRHAARVSVSCFLSLDGKRVGHGQRRRPIYPLVNRKKVGTIANK